MQAALIEEVVGDFVALKRAGANFRGLSPFTNEKTPSFYVVPAKGIYKDFSSGNGGNAVNFLMEHEKLSYPEALRWLANKYNIEIEEDRDVDKAALEQARNERESLLIVNAFAQKFFADYLLTDERGKSIGLSYFRQRGLSPQSIETFGLGFAPESRTAFTEAALKAGYQRNYLESLGLTVTRDDGSFYDRFAGRVMFPIHDISGKVIAFGGRILKKDEKTAKYLNSPESELYHKSKVLYGLFQAKKAIIKEDLCFLVEGYTDVISMHQAGIQNVVASAGTSLTEDQARLIRRFTNNVTVLYDGDAAGIRASIRGIDILLEQGLDVRVLLLPDGQDPDSFAQSNPQELERMVKEDAKDFVSFKADMLLKDASNDPLKKADVLKELARTISIIDDPMKRSVLTTEVARNVAADERVLIAEVNKHRLDKKLPKEERQQAQVEIQPVAPPQEEPKVDSSTRIPQERYLMKLLVLHAEKPFEDFTVAQRVVEELEGYDWEDSACASLFTHIASNVLSEKEVKTDDLVQIQDPQLSKMVVDYLTSDPTLSKHWEEKYDAQIPTPDDNYVRDLHSALDRLKLKMLVKWMDECDAKIKNPASDEELLEELNHKKLLQIEIKEIADKYGITIIR